MTGRNPNTPCTCEVCGITFYRWPVEAKTARFCSMSCRTRGLFRTPRPDRALVERIAAEEASRARVAPIAVLAMSTTRGAIRARRNAFARIVAETGCTYAALAEVWGCDRQIPGRYVKQRTAAA